MITGKPLGRPTLERLALPGTSDSGTAELQLGILRGSVRVRCVQKYLTFTIDNRNIQG